MESRRAILGGGLAALATAALILSVTVGFASASPESGPDATTAKKKKKKPCAGKKGKAKKKCRKTQGQNGQNGDQEGVGSPSLVFITSGCPTGTVDGNVPVTITGTASPPKSDVPVRVDYTKIQGSTNVTVLKQPVFTDAAGNWSVTFQAHEGGAFAGTAHMLFIANYNGGATGANQQRCEWDFTGAAV